MSTYQNPYQAPIAADIVYAAETVSEHLLWRKGNLLVMHKLALLPDRCVKSNVPTTRRLKRSLSWHHPALFLAVLISLLIYIILALLLRKTATIHIGLSDEWFARRRRAIMIGWSMGLLSLVIVFTGIVSNDGGNSPLIWLIPIGIVLFLVSLFYGLFAARMVTATRVSDTHVWIKGVCAEFLEGLPEWPYKP